MLRLLFFLLPLFLAAYEYNSFFISTFLGYRSDEQKFSFQNIREKLDGQNTLIFGLSSEYYSGSFPFVSARFQYGFPYASSAETEMTLNNPSASGTAIFCLRGDFYDLEGKMGLPFRFGPLTFVPLVGMFYENETLKRHDISPVSMNGAIFGPKSLVKSEYVTPLAGIFVILEPWPFTNLRFRTGYDFRFGWFEGKTGYFINTDSGSTFRGFSQNIRVNQFSWGHIFHLEGYFGLPMNFVLGIFFDYEYLRVKSGSADENLDGIEVIGGFSRPISRNQKIPYGGLTRQMYRTAVQVSYTF